MRLFVATLFVAAATPLCRSAVSESEDDLRSPGAYEIVANAVIPVLPPPLRTYFRDNRDAVLRSTAAHAASAKNPRTTQGDASRHFVMLDVAAVGGDAADRRSAARRFPHKRAEATRLFKRYGVAVGGSLPWTIHGHYNGLVKAFRSNEPDLVLREAGALIHFSTDAALPFNTTAIHDSACISHLGPSAAGASQTGALQTVLRQHYHVELLARLHRRLAYEIRVSPERYRRLSRPLDAVFDLLLETHSVVDAILAIDAEVVAELGIIDAAALVPAKDRYYSELGKHAAPIMESRLEAAALLSANLIGTAWVQAGSPSIAASVGINPSAALQAPPQEKREESFVGSRHSNIFHLVRCRHAKRIKPENRVFFNRKDEAITAGRTPCKTCKPNDQ